MALRNVRIKVISLVIITITLAQCRTVDPNSAAPTNEISYQATKASSVTPTTASLSQPTASTSHPGCVYPPTQVSDLNTGYFYWSANSESIIYQETSGQVWYSYNTISGQTNRVLTEISATPTIDFTSWKIDNSVDNFLSPRSRTVVFTRGTPEKYEVYYKNLNKGQDYYLGSIRGYIKKVEWLDNEKKVVIAMDWQAPIYPEAPVYMIDFSKDELSIEMSKENDYKNIEYLGLTPDETRFMFVSYRNKHEDVTVKLWNISTDEITSTPVFNPLDFQWISESELIAISQNEGLFSVVSVLLYDINSSELTYLADKSITTSLIRIAPHASSIAYIENETNKLYWTICRQ